MAFTAQSVISIADALSKANTFLTANGWTCHYSAGNGEFAAEKNPSGSTWITMAAQWDTGSPRGLGIYQWHGATYNSGSSPWNQNNDSGVGAASTTDATIRGMRCVDLNSGPEYMWIFEDDDYFHMVLRHDTDRYQHLGAGLLEKYNDWTGGEYCYGQAVDTVYNSDTAIRPAASYLLDGLAADQVSSYLNMEERCATLHIEGMDEQGGSDIWGVVLGNQSSSNLGTDRGANPHIHINGGFRAGLFAKLFGQFAGTTQRGLVPMYPIVVAYWNRTNDDVYGPLGVMQDVRGISIKNFTAEQEITVGSDTWVVFPSHRRRDSGAGASYTQRQGIAYKQVS
jgi:hypothetical protein